jgi:hypothetical protein
MEYVYVDTTGNEYLFNLNAELESCRKCLLYWRHIGNVLARSIEESKHTKTSELSKYYNQHASMQASRFANLFRNRFAVLRARIEEEEDRLIEIAELMHIAE